MNRFTMAIDRDKTDVLSKGKLILTDKKTGKTYTIDKHELTVHDLRLLVEQVVNDLETPNH